MIVTLMILIVFIAGIAFGVKLSDATAGTNGMEITIFSLSFLTVVMTFLIFTQVMHVRERIEPPAARQAQAALKQQSPIPAKPKRR